MISAAGIAIRLTGARLSISGKNKRPGGISPSLYFPTNATAPRVSTIFPECRVPGPRTRRSKHGRRAILREQGRQTGAPRWVHGVASSTQPGPAARCGRTAGAAYSDSGRRERAQPHGLRLRDAGPGAADVPRHQIVRRCARRLRTLSCPSQWSRSAGHLGGTAGIRENSASVRQQSFHFRNVPRSAAVAEIDQALQGFSQFPDPGLCSFEGIGPSVFPAHTKSLQ